MAFWAKLKFWKRPLTQNLQRGRLGEDAAKTFLRNKGLKFLVANYVCKRGEIDLVFRDEDALVFVEVKTRSSEAWTRPARAVNWRKRRALRATAEDYLRRLPTPAIKYRFDIVEVLLEQGKVREIRHLQNADMRRGLERPRSVTTLRNARLRY